MWYRYGWGRETVIGLERPRATGLWRLVLIMLCCECALASAALSEPPRGGEDEVKILQKQAALDLRRVWRFDEDRQGQAPGGFSAHTLGGDLSGSWQVTADPQAPSAPNVLRQGASCPGDGCFQILLAEGVSYDYLDLTLKLRPVPGDSRDIGGVVFAAQDPRNFYAVLVDFSQDTLSVVRLLDGQETVLGNAPLKRKDMPWHLLRVQRNTILSKEFIEASFDHALTVSVRDQTLGAGRIGLVTRGGSSIAFDNIHVIRMYSQRPLSGPAAY